MSLVISLTTVDKRFASGVQPLTRISLDVAPGAFVALLGPSGCGKTTVLRLAAGLEQPSGGALALGAAPPALSYVFPEPTLMPWASVADNVALPLRIARLPAARIGARVTSALAAARLERFVASVPAELSGA